MKLSDKKCMPCESGTKPLEKDKVNGLLKLIPSWSVKEGRLYKKFKFNGFLDAIKFVNSIASIAEQENHHPDITIQYSKVEIIIWTHSINGLSENDFILAAKIDKK